MTQPTAEEARLKDVNGNDRIGPQQPAIANIIVTGNYATDDTPIETAINSILAVMRLNGDIVG